MTDEILTMPNSNESLTNHMLVQVKITSSSGTKTANDKAVQYSASEGARSKVMNVSMELFVNDAKLHAIRKYRTTIDNWMRRIAYPWGDNLWLLPGFKFPQFMADYAQHEVNFNTLVDSFMFDYDDAIKSAAFVRGPLFNIRDYATRQEMQSKFSIKLFTYDIPRGHFLVQCEDQLKQHLKDHFENQTKQQLQGVLDRQTEKLLSVLGSLSNTCEVDTVLDDKGEQKVIRGRLHESTFNLARELCDEYAQFNLAVDPVLEQARMALAATLSGVEFGQLKHSDALRTSVKRNVDEIISSLKSDPTLSVGVEAALDPVLDAVLDSDEPVPEIEGENKLDDLLSRM